MKMKKNNLLILAVAALGFAACANDETTAVNEKLAESNAISFRANVNGQMRAADINATTLETTGFYVSARKHSPDGEYFTDAAYTIYTSGSKKTWTCATKYYWPADDSELDFYAYSPKAIGDGHNAQITAHANYKTFTVQPSTIISEQVDLIFANTNQKKKSTNNDGVVLNFRHAESKIVVRFKNGQAHMKIDVLAFKIVNVDGSATYTYTATNNTSTDGNNSRTLADEWTDNTNYTQTYTGTPTAMNQLDPSTTTAVYLQDDGIETTTENEDLSMILIPQETNPVAAYTGTVVGNGLEANKSYIAVKMIIRNNDSLDDGTEAPATNTNGTIIANCTGDGDWAIWPVAFNWKPGKKYIYTIDLGDGGYWEKEHVAGDTDLDPVLEGAEIKFVDVTVDDWSNGGETAVSGPSI